MDELLECMKELNTLWRKRSVDLPFVKVAIYSDGSGCFMHGSDTLRSFTALDEMLPVIQEIIEAEKKLQRRVG